MISPSSASVLPVDIIVPVFRGLDETIACLESVLSAPNAQAFELVVIDDCTPETAISDYLKTLSETRQITLIRNECNLGFVASANRGMALHCDRDVVLLNSDTEVANNWLERLQRCAYAQDKIGTVTPFSNNATICSYPIYCAENSLPVGFDLARLDAIFSSVNDGQFEDIPTAVGFCMYIRRACLDAVGLFDADAFGRGYGEENDFSRRIVAAGWRNVVCADTFVYHAGGVSFSDERKTLQERASATMERLHPGYGAMVKRFIEHDPLLRFRYAVDRSLSLTAGVSRVRTGPAQLHITHDLGGGAIKWLKDYCNAEDERVNLVLKPWTHSHAYGDGLALYVRADAERPLRFWRFDVPIQATVMHHSDYRQIIAEIVAVYHVDAVLVSSLLGHSLDALETGKPTVIVCHDYFPYCPAINLYFDGICQSCEPARLRNCADRNQDYNPFLAFGGQDRLEIRDAYLDRVVSLGLPLICPSESVRDNLIRLNDRFKQARFHVIPHGSDDFLSCREAVIHTPGERLRILVLGQMSVAKGSRLLLAVLDDLTQFADVYLLGCGEVGEMFRYRSGVHVVRRYEATELSGHVAAIRPHVGLLTSVCAETYGYTLTELFRMGIPPVAVRAGSHAERILHGETGLLVNAVPDDIVAMMRELLSDKQAVLARIASNLRSMGFRSAVEMVRDYREVLSKAHSSVPAGIFQDVKMKFEDSFSGGVRDDQALLMADMWKELKSLRLSAGLLGDTHERLDRRCRELGVEIANLQSDLTSREQAIHDQAKQLQDFDKLVQDRNGALAELEHQVAFQNAELNAMRASTSWRVTKIIRLVGGLMPRIRLLGRCLAPLVRHPRHTPSALRGLLVAWRHGGLPSLKGALLHLPSIENLDRRWSEYQGSFDSARAEILRRIDAMPELPLISVLVPIWETPEHMLRQMLQSVVDQLYPNWQLCIADDGSKQSHVRRVLEEYAASDARIILAPGLGNFGVSHASNRALAKADGVFTVLLDHDDTLEPQALFRVAESILAEAPDMLYSDEILVSGADQHIMQMVLRPAFSPEYLRAHPYIVHMVGFRTSLLRDIGGFDESLKISQDYDLILRASERARRIVHIPEVLYRWRIHSSSAGHALKNRVMDVSRAALGRHLERCGESGHVNDGPVFNFFDVRHPLQKDVRVAIIIPTKNHGDLLRQCIESFRWSIRHVNYDIVVVDHDSDDLSTRAYLNDLAPDVRVLRYSGDFNFSAINNWAISELPDRYSHFLLCNNDIEALHEGWLERLVEQGQKPDVGIVGALLYYPDGETIQHAGVCVGLRGPAEHYAKFLRPVGIGQKMAAVGRMAICHEVSAVTAACLLISKVAYDEVGGMDESIVVGFGDVDLCLKVLEKGYRIVFNPYAALLHHESITRGTNMLHPEDTARFMARWGAFVAAGDPYYHPGFSSESTSWEFASPLRFNVDIGRRLFERDNLHGRQSIRISPPAEQSV